MQRRPGQSARFFYLLAENLRVSVSQVMSNKKLSLAPEPDAYNASKNIDAT